MIKVRNTSEPGVVKVSFVLPADDSRLPASVVGSFNHWDEHAAPFRRRSNGTASAVVELEDGRRHRFRYRSFDGTWFNDEAADEYEPNQHGSTDCILVL